ncbi:MAG TPA: hypothetical protein VMU54_18780 [Planctomycetota bacterium]|nr:hypothetical protein [Planctomycetota bacterium]
MAAPETPDSRLFDKLDRDEFDSDRLLRGLTGPFSVVGAILRAPGALIRDLGGDRNLSRYSASLILTTMLFSAAYGSILGLFEPGVQTLYAAAKLPLVVVGTAMLCTPTFYVFNAILGSPFTFRQAATAILFLSASTALVLLAFAPIAWFFTVSTGGRGFLTFFHLLIFVVAAGYGMRSLNQARRYLAHVDRTRISIHGGFLFLWFLIVLFVALQMAYYLRPFLEPLPDHRFFTGERGLFFDVFSLPTAGARTGSLD